MTNCGWRNRPYCKLYTSIPPTGRSTTVEHPISAYRRWWLTIARLKSVNKFLISASDVTYSNAIEKQFSRKLMICMKDEKITRTFFSVLSATEM